jgi:hypothetical protein
MNYVKSKPISPKLIGGEDKIQEIIANDPSVIGLGSDLKWIEREKKVFGGGRLDILLAEPGNKTRYAVEIQLGNTDESHIIRTIEYWDLLERTNPTYDHVAVIVAEHLSGRFFNVIRLFHERIPLIAIQMMCIEVEGKATLAFTKVLDLSPEQSGLETESSSSGKEVEAGWRNYAGPKIMQVVDEIFALAKEIDKDLRLNFTQSYVAINRGASRSLSTIIYPQKKQVRIGLYSVESPDDMEKLFQDAGVDASMNSSWGPYSFAIRPDEFEKRKGLLRDLMRHLYGKDHGD